MIFIKFFLNLIIFFLSLINVWKSRKLNLRKANYFIIKNNEDLIDTRSVRFTNLNKKDLSKSLNFVRCVSLSLSFKSLFYLKNIVVIDSLYNFILQKNKILEKKSVNTNKEYSRIITQIIKYSKINEFKMIDDYRLMSLFLPILNKLKIFSIGYMHGRISKDLEYQKNLQLFKFDKYYVWNEYFKEKILRINKKYQKKEIFIKNPLKKYTTKNLIKTNGLCFIEEDNIKLGTYRKIISELKKQKKFKIYFKFRPNNRPNHALLGLLKKNNIQYFFKENVYKLFTQYNIKILFAFNSSLLVECSYYNVIPIMIYSNKIFLQEYIKDGIVFGYRLNNIKNIFNQQVQITKKFKTMKKSIWKYN
jgi:hypothetical protein